MSPMPARPRAAGSAYPPSSVPSTVIAAPPIVNETTAAAAAFHIKSRRLPSPDPDCVAKARDPFAGLQRVASAHVPNVRRPDTHACAIVGLPCGRRADIPSGARAELLTALTAPPGRIAGVPAGLARSPPGTSAATPVGVQTTWTGTWMGGVIATALLLGACAHEQPPPPPAATA